MMELQSNLTYQNFKQTLDSELEKAAEGFVRIGYLLRIARDTDILKESGYANVNEFAQEEYNLDKSQVSRFIRINENFGDPEHPEQLRKKYQDFGYAKLALMLQLPESIREELSPEYTKSEIQEIKEEVDEERKITDMEVCLEEKPDWQQDEDPIINKVVKQLFHDEPQLYLNVCGVIQHGQDENEIFRTMTPIGEITYSIRIAGEGRFLLNVKDSGVVTLMNIRSSEKEQHTAQIIVDIINDLLLNVQEGEEEKYWESLYGEAWPVKEQEPQKEEKKPEQKHQKPKEKKPSKVVKAGKKEEVAPVQPEPEESSEIQEEVPVEKEEPDVMPEATEEELVESESIDEEQPQAAAQETEPEDTEERQQDNKMPHDLYMSLAETLDAVLTMAEEKVYNSAIMHLTKAKIIIEDAMKEEEKEYATEEQEENQ